MRIVLVVLSFWGGGEGQSGQGGSTYYIPSSIPFEIDMKFLDQDGLAIAFVWT